MTNISVIIVSRNEAKSLDRCLASVQGFSDDITVIDLESTDGTKEVVNRHRARFVSHKYVELVEEIRQSSLKYAKYEYILLLDPDEELPPPLAKTLLKNLSSNPAYIKMPRKNMVFGKWIEHSMWWPDYQFRLFRKSQVNWPKVIHAQPEIKGEGITLDPTEANALLHHNYETVDQWIDKNKRYAKANAQEFISSGNKLTLAMTIIKSIGQITERFFKAQGYRDGLHGLMLAFLQAFYYLHVYLYYWEMQKFGNIESEQEIKNFPINYFSHGVSEIIYWQVGGKLSFKDKIIRKLL